MYAARGKSVNTRDWTRPGRRDRAYDSICATARRRGRRGCGCPSRGLGSGPEDGVSDASPVGRRSGPDFFTHLLIVNLHILLGIVPQLDDELGAALVLSRIPLEFLRKVENMVADGAVKVRDALVVHIKVLVRPLGEHLLSVVAVQVVDCPVDCDRVVLVDKHQRHELVERILLDGDVSVDHLATLGLEPLLPLGFLPLLGIVIHEESVGWVGIVGGRRLRREKRLEEEEGVGRKNWLLETMVPRLKETIERKQ